MVNSFSKLHLCFGARRRRLPVGPARPATAALGELLRRFHHELLAARPRLELDLEVPDCDEPLSLLWLPAGQTAGVAFWLRQRRIEAITLLLTGLDCEEDFQAIAMASRAATSPFPAQAYQALVKTKPPVMATVYRSANAFRDPAIATASLSLALAFFNILGVSAEAVASQ